MKIEIWSDVMCPFCYIGKRNLENALSQFKDKNHLEIIWKSYQLDPTISETANITHEDYLMNKRGFSSEQVKGMLSNVTQMAKQAGLDYHLDKSQMVNSFKAHKFLQLAEEQHKGDQAEEVLFRSFFTDGENVSDDNVLITIGKEIGITEEDTKKALADEKYAKLVNDDIMEARNLGVTGVPFFVFDRKYAVSGAQPPQAFLQTLEKAFTEWRKQNPEVKLEIIQGESCSVDGECK